MIIVHPYDIIGLQQLFQMGSEILIDADIPTKVAPRKFGKVEPIMQNRPQHAIGESIVEFLIVILAEINGCVSDVVVGNGLHSVRHIFGNASAPAKPEAAVPLERGSDRHFEAARPSATIRYANSVRHYDEPRQYRSPQLRDSLIAVKVSPDIEYVCGKFPHNFPVSGCTSSD